MNYEIPPASLAQIRRGRLGEFVLIEDDVCFVAQQLKEIHPSLGLRYSVSGEYFVVYQTVENGDQHLVTTAQELDGRLLRKVRRITSERYDFGRELDRLDAAADRDIAHRFSEAVGDVGERLYHAMRRDLGSRDQISVPKSSTGSDSDEQVRPSPPPAERSRRDPGNPAPVQVPKEIPDGSDTEPQS